MLLKKPMILLMRLLISQMMLLRVAKEYNSEKIQSMMPSDLKSFNKMN